MKRTFLIIMLFLLPLQYTWAMVANYDLHGVHHSDAHFGHHSHSNLTDTNNLDSSTDKDDDANAKTSKSHEHYGFFHISCGELVGQTLPEFEAVSSCFSNHYLFDYRSPPSNALDRPKWTAAV